MLPAAAWLPLAAPPPLKALGVSPQFLHAQVHPPLDLSHRRACDARHLFIRMPAEECQVDRLPLLLRQGIHGLADLRRIQVAADLVPKIDTRQRLKAFV